MIPISQTEIKFKPINNIQEFIKFLGLSKRWTLVHLQNTIDITTLTLKCYALAIDKDNVKHFLVLPVITENDKLVSEFDCIWLVRNISPGIEELTRK